MVSTSKVALLVLAALLAAPLAAPAFAGAGAASLPTFRLADAGVTGPELNLGVSPNGKIFVGGWDRIARSSDDGVTWTHVDPRPVGFAADRVLIVDKDTGRVLIDDTYLGCTILAWSDDDGATWTNNPSACGSGATDHQKIAVGKRITLPDTGLYANLIYVCANGLSHTDCGVSNDGGLTFQNMAPHGAGCAFQGTPVADVNGVLYEPTSQCGLKVRKTLNNGLTWGEISVPAFSVSRDTPDLAVTSDSTVYVFYTDATWKPVFMRGTNGGTAWTGPHAVPVPGLTSAVFPSVVAGANGKIALSFYGTTDNPPAWDKNPGNAPASVKWHGYVAVVTDANALAPTVTPVQVTPAADPLQIGPLSKLGSSLNNIADYMDVDVGPDGRVYAVFTDGCLAGCTTSAQSTADRAVVAVQTGGSTLL
jgi:hypothetical protein